MFKLKTVGLEGRSSTTITSPTIIVTRIKRNEKSIVVNGEINGMGRILTLDTGATNSLLRRGLDNFNVQPATDIQLRTATGEQAEVYGRTWCKIGIGDKLFEHEFIVADITDDVIIGSDFLLDNGFVMDMKNCSLRYENMEVPFVIGEPNGNVVRKLSVVNREEIPAQSEAIIWTKSDVVNDRSTLMVGPTRKKIRDNVVVGRTLVRPTAGFIPIRVMNLSDVARSFKKGEVVALAETVCGITNNEEECDTTVEPPSEFGSFVQEWTNNLESVKQKQRANRLFQKYCCLFFGEGDKNGRTNVIRHRINTGNVGPIRQRPRRLPLAKRKEVDELISDMRQDDVIEPSGSPWCSPVVLVKKKDGTTRFCVDYRKLNDITIKDSYPLPRIDDTLDTLSGSVWFSALDLKSGYWQVEIEDKDKEKTAFSVGNGLWQFKVMPFGLCNAPATFERLMEYVLRGLHWKICLLYLDDIIVMGKNFNDHVQNLEGVFKRLRLAGLKVNPKKCEFFKHEVKYLGHKVTSNGVQTDENKIKAVKDWIKPNNIKELRSFLGFCTYYRRFVPGFATLASPLHDLTCSQKEFIWEEEQEDAFQKLKEALCSAPILSYPVPGVQFILDTDASASGIGSVLSQILNGEEKVIAYYSTRLSKAERNYCVTRRELLAVIRSIKHFHKYLYGQKFVLRTDHAALRWLINFREPEGQLARWIEELQSYDFHIEHRKGTKHGNADGLSRLPCQEECRHCSKYDHQNENEWIRRCEVSPWYKWNKDCVKTKQQEDPILGKIVTALERNKRPTWEEVSSEAPMIKAYWAQWDSLELKDGLLYRTWESEDGRVRKQLLVVPQNLQIDVLQECHSGSSGGHLGIRKTLEKIKIRFYWIGCQQSVVNFLRSCDACSKAKGPLVKSRGPMKQYNVGAPFERVAVDILGPFPVSTSGNRYVVIVMDYFSKWPEAYPISNMDAETVADVIVKQWIARFGVPMELHSDQGRNFESDVFRRICESFGIHKTRTTALHPQSDGMVERFNRTLVEHLKKVINGEQKSWDKHIPMFLMAYRAAVHESTSMSPARIIFGNELRLPADLKFGLPGSTEMNLEDYVDNQRLLLDKIHEEIRVNLKLMSNKMKARYDMRVNCEGFAEGQLVLLYNPKRRRGQCMKLQSNWEGPYMVIKRINDVIYRIRNCSSPRSKMKVVHLARLAKYTGSA